MHYSVIPPPNSLNKYIRYFWVLESNTPYLHRSMADGFTEMIFHYRGTFDEILHTNEKERSWTAGIHGQSHRFRRFTTNTGFGIFGVYLYPFAIPCFFGIPSHVVADQMVDLSTLFGQQGRDLEDKMMCAKDNDHRIRIITHFFEHRLRNVSCRPDVALSMVNMIIQNKGMISVDALAEKCCLSRRHFERKFKDFSGFSPKLFSRIIRFQCAREQYRNCPSTLTDIAYSCGYYDQSHFINDFKEFSGYHPKTFFSGKAEGTDWMNPD